MFVIDNHKKYIIYGIGGNGLKVQKVLHHAQYTVECFIDMRADSVKTVADDRVLNLNDAIQMVKDKSNCVVIITIKDVFEHGKIARKLAAAGFSHCIYKPLEILQGMESDELLQISKIHDRFIVDLEIPEKVSLPETTFRMQLNFQERLLIRREAGKVIVWLPIELLFNYHNGEPYECINMALFSPLVELYKAFMGEFAEKEECDSAIENFIFYSMEWMKKNHIQDTEDLRKSLIHSRYKAFSEMQRIAETDQDFFIRNAPEVSYEKGRFFMSSSGRNRVAFLIAKKYRFVPVKIEEESYLKWKNKDQMDLVEKYMEQNEMESLRIPFPHPLLSSLQEECTDYVSLFVMNCLNLITKQMLQKSQKEENGLRGIVLEEFYRNRDKIQLECLLNDEGCFRRTAKLCGFHAKNMNPCLVNAELEKELDHLLYIQEENKDTLTGQVIFVLDSKLCGKMEIAYHLADQIFLLAWGNQNNLMDRICEEGFHVVQKMFCAVWNLEKVEGYFLSR